MTAVEMAISSISIVLNAARLNRFAVPALAADPCPGTKRRTDVRATSDMAASR